MPRHSSENLIKLTEKLLFDPKLRNTILKRKAEPGQSSFGLMQMVDLISNNYTVYSFSGNTMAPQLGEVIATYEDIDALLDDGWVVD